MARTVKHRPDTAHIGTIPTNQLGSGTANSTTFLRGDQTWNTPASTTADHNHTTTAGDGGDLDAARVGDYVDLTEVAAPGTPGSGLVRLYAKAAGLLYSKDDAGLETALGGGGGGTDEFTTDGVFARLATGLLAVGQIAGATEAYVELNAGFVRVYASGRVNFEANESNPGGAADAKFYFYGGHGLVLPIDSADPSGGDEEEAQLYFNDSSDRFRGYANGLWGALSLRQGSGTTTITSGNTFVAVTHGAGYTPAAQDITVTPTNSPTNDPGHWWVDTIGATTFRINVRADPGVSGATFGWRVTR